MDESSLSYRGWRTVALCFALALFAWTLAFYGQSIYLAELQRLHGWSSFAVSSATTFAYFVGACMVLFVGDAIERLGPRRFLLIGVGCLALAMVGIGRLTAPWQLYPVYLLIAIGWSAMSVVAISTLVSHWFEARRGKAISIALNGASFGGIVGAPAVLAAVGQAGLERALQGAALVMLAVLVPMILAWAHKPARARHAAAPVAAPRADAGTRRRTLRSPAFWSLAGPFALASFAQVGFVVHLVAILEPSIGKALAGVALLTVSAAAVVGRTALGLVIDRLDLRVTSALILVSQAVAQWIVAGSDSSVALLGACALFGLSFGNVLVLPPLLVQREFEMRDFAMVVGLASALSQITYAFGPGVLGLLRDATEGYTVPLAVCMALNLAAAVFMLAARRRPAPASGPRATR